MQKKRRPRKEGDSAAVAPSPAVARAGEDGAAFESSSKKNVADRERHARNTAAVSAGDVGALEKKGKKNEGDRQRRKDANTVASAGDPGALATHREDRKRKVCRGRCGTSIPFTLRTFPKVQTSRRPHGNGSRRLRGERRAP